MEKVNLVDWDTVDEILNRRLSDATGLLQELVRIPSYRGAERKIQDRISELFKSRDLSVRKIPVNAEHLMHVQGYSKSDIALSEGSNIVAVLPGSGQGRSLAINFHSDVAPPGPSELWDFDPLSGEVRDGRVCGRGSWDDKAGCVLAILVLDTLRELEIVLKGDLIFQSVIEDEFTGNGTLAVLDAGYTTDAAIILDGAYGPTAIIGHPGYVNFRTTVYGKPAPSCRSDLGENAIEKAYLIIEHLRNLKMELSKNIPEGWMRSGNPINLNIAKISGGDWIGTVASKCVFETQLSFLPPLDIAAAKEKILSSVQGIVFADDWLSKNPPEIDFFDMETDPLWLDTENEFISILNSGCKLIFGTELNTRVVTGWCDLRHFYRYGAIPSCLFGPGKGGNAHRPNEFFEIAELVPHAKVLLNQVLNWCQE